MTAEIITVSTDIQPVVVETETIRRIHFDQHCIEVGSHEANVEWVHVRAENDASCEYYASLDLSLPPSVALAVGRALVLQATEQGGA